MSYFESLTEYKEFACDAIGFPIIAYDDYKNDCEKEMIENSGKCLRPWIFETLKTLVILIDSSNTVLDYILAVHLHRMGAPGYAGLLGVMTTLSLAVSVWMKFLMYCMRKYEVMTPEFILPFVLLTELFIFAFENVTTLLLLTRVDGGGNLLVDRSELFGANLNLWTTILSGICVGLLLITFILLMVFEKSGLCYILPQMATIFYVWFMLYFAIDKVLLENPMEETEDLHLKVVYIVNMVICLILLLCSQFMVWALFAFSGGN